MVFMRARLVHLAVPLALAGSLAAGYAAPRSHTTAASKTVTFVTDIGGLNDNGFNHLGYIGTKNGARVAGYNAKYIETTSSSDYVKNITTAARNSQFVAAVGYSFEPAMMTVPKKYPNVQFTIIDSSVHAQNVLANVFMPNQSSYLAGILAAGVSKTHKIGFVGGVQGPVIDAFLAGFQAGAKSYDSQIKVYSAYTGSFTDAGAGKNTATSEINSGADVIFAAAGGSGLGSLAAASPRHLLSIGVDADQHYLYPNSVVSSVVKHVETAVADAIVKSSRGTFKGGVVTWDLKNGGVGLAPYYNLSSRVSSTVRAAIAKARAGIVRGDINVPITPTK